MKIRINPPPQDMRCEICGKHVDDLEPFEGLEDLFEVSKDMAEEFKLWDEYFRATSVTKDKKLLKNYRESCGLISASWECRDCVYKE